MTGPEEGLIAEEGVNEGSRASLRDQPHETPDDLGGAPAQGGPGAESDPAGPLPTDAPDVRQAQAAAPGQELAEGEG